MLYIYWDYFLFTFMHLADAFIQSDLQCIQAIHFCQYAKLIAMFVGQNKGMIHFPFTFLLCHEFVFFSVLLFKCFTV